MTLVLEDDWANLSVDCPGCGKSITVPNRNITPESPIASSPDSSQERYSSAYYIDGWMARALDGFSIFGGLGALFMVVSLISSVIITFNADKNESHGVWLCFFISLPFGLLGIWGLKFTSDLKKPYKKITETSATNTFLIIYGIINGIASAGVVIMCTIGMISGAIKTPYVFLGIPVVMAGVIAIFPVWKFYKQRAAEDAHFSAEEIAAEKEFFEKINADGHDSYRVNTWRSLARIFAFMGFIPFFGLLMSLLSALFIWLAIKKGQTGMGKIIALAVFTFIIDVILILTIRS